MQSEQFYDRIISNEPELKGDVMTVAEQSEAKGKLEGKQEIAIEMLKEGLHVDQVARIAKLTKHEVLKLKGLIKH